MGLAAGLCTTGKLGENNDRHLEILCHELEVSGDFRDLLYSGFRPVRRFHELEIVDDDAVHIFHPDDFRLHLVDTDVGGVVEVERALMQSICRRGQIFPVSRFQISISHFDALDPRLHGDDPGGKLFFCHLQREEKDLLTPFGDVGGNIQSKTRLTHGWTGTDNDEIRPVETGNHLI